MAVDLNSLDFFNKDNWLTEEATGIVVNSDGNWSTGEIVDEKTYFTRLWNMKSMICNMKRLSTGKPDIIVNDDVMSATIDNSQSFDENGHIPDIKFKCPNCGKEVEMLLNNGYCSTTCYMQAKAAAAQKKISNAGEKVLELLENIQAIISLIDMVLNIITLIPDLIKDSVRLPSEYRDFVIIYIETAFLELRKIINNLQIKRNNYVIQLLKKIKVGSIDATLGKIVAPVNAIISVIGALQQTLNAYIEGVMLLLQNPALGAIPGNGGHGFVLSAKSFQHPQTAGKIFVTNTPTVNMGFAVPSMLNAIDTSKIDNLIMAALPPIQPAEWFLEPTAFKVRYAMSYNNAPKVKMLIQLLENLCFSVAGECFPRYKNLVLWRPGFVLAILTGWGPLTRVMFGDFLFHATL